MRLTKVVGAVPVIAVAPLEVAVPPVMLADVPAPEEPSLTQVVTRVRMVDPASSAAVVLMYSPEYGDTALLSWNSVVAAAPGVRS